MREEVFERPVRHLTIERLGPAPKCGREGPEDAGVEHAALAGARVRMPVDGDGSKEATLLPIDGPGRPIRQDIPAQLALSGGAQCSK
jgi:hypothetical protein